MNIVVFFLKPYMCTLERTDNVFRVLFEIDDTRPKPVEHGYVFNMAVGTIGEWLKLVPFLLGDE